MKSYRFAITFLIFSVLCWNGYALIAKDGSKLSQTKRFLPADTNSPGESTDIQSLKIRTADLERKVVSLLKQLKQVKADVGKESHILTHQIASVDMDVNLQDRRNESEFSDPMTDLQQAEMIEQQQQAALETAFANQDVDEKWSDKSTQAIDSVLDNEFVENAEIIDSACHSTLCRLEVRHQDREQLASFEELLPLQLGGSFPELTMRHETGEDGEVSTVVFLAREGHDLPYSE